MSRCTFVALMLLVAACSGEPAPAGPEPERPMARPARIQIAGGNGQTDSIDAPLTLPYRVLVTDSASRPVAGVVLRAAPSTPVRRHSRG